MRLSSRFAVSSEVTPRARRRGGMSGYASTAAWNPPARMWPRASKRASAAMWRPCVTAHWSIKSSSRRSTVTGSHDRRRPTASPISRSFRRTISARTGTASLGPLTQVRLLHPPEMCRIHVAGDGPRHEAHALVLVATHEAGPGRDDFVGQEGGRVVQDDQIDASTRGHLEIGHEPVQALGRRRAREEDGDVRVALRAGLAAHERTEEVRESDVGARLENAPNRIQAVHNGASIASRRRTPLRPRGRVRFCRRTPRSAQFWTGRSTTTWMILGTPAPTPSYWKVS